MSYEITEEHRQTFQDDGIVKLPGVLDSALLDELNACFDWAVQNPGPTRIGDTKGDEFTFVDLGNPAGRQRYEEAITHGPFAQIAGDLWQSEFVGFLTEEVFWKKGKAERTFWHQDTPYAPWGGAHWANFWMPLSAHPAEYAIQVVRGTHTGVMYDGTTFNPQDPTEPLWGDAADFPRLPDIAADLARDPSAWDVVSFDVVPGDIVVLHPNSLHSGGPADEHLPERRTLVFRFFGDQSFYSGHLPDAPGFYENPPIPSASGGYLEDGDPFRPAGAIHMGSALPA